MARAGKTERKTKETDISVSLNVDGSGRAEVKTGMPFLDHMLDIFTRHGLFDITISAKGDLDVDYHHTVEDVGLALHGVDLPRRPDAIRRRTDAAWCRLPAGRIQQHRR